MNIQCRMLKGEKRETIHFVIPDVETAAQLRRVSDPAYNKIKKVIVGWVTPPGDICFAAWYHKQAWHARVYLFLALEFYEYVSKSIFLC